MITEIMQVETNIWLYILPFIVPAITALIMFLRKEGKSDANAGMTRYEVIGLKEDTKEIKNDIKDLHQKSQDALRQIDLLDLRLKNVEDHRHGAVS